MNKKKSLSSTKKKLWKLVSEYVRRSNSNVDGFCDCVTCGKTYQWKAMDAGHFVGGHKNYNFFDLRNIHPQCTYCNRYMHGNLLAYNDFMLKEYGEDVVNSLRKYEIKIFTISELEEKIERYKRLLKDIS